MHVCCVLALATDKTDIRCFRRLRQSERLAPRRKKEGKAMETKKITVCPHCGRTGLAGNFCSGCAGKLVKECDCLVLHRKFNCGLEKCPGYKLLVLLLKAITFVEKFQYSGYGIIIKPLNKKLLPITTDFFKSLNK